MKSSVTIAFATLSVLFNLVAVILWKWNTAQPAIVDIALGERSIPEGQSLFQAITSGSRRGDIRLRLRSGSSRLGRSHCWRGRRPQPSRTGIERRQGILRVHAAEDSRTRRDVEEVIDAHAKRWVFESDDRGADGLPTLTYEIQLKKRYEPGRPAPCPAGAAWSAAGGNRTDQRRASGRRESVGRGHSAVVVGIDDLMVR